MKKCPVCNKEVLEEEAIYNTNTKRYYHESCYNILLDRKKLVDYICELFGYKKPSVKVYQQMTSYYNKGISYADMLLALRYFYEVKKGDINKAQGGIGIITYVLDEAKNFASLEEIERNNLIQKFQENELNKKETIYRQIVEFNNNKNKKQIDINSL